MAVTIGKMSLVRPGILIVRILSNICLGNRPRIDHNNQEGAVPACPQHHYHFTSSAIMAKKDADNRREREDSADLDMDFGPKAKTPLLAVVLIFLNIVAALGFTFLLVMDYSKRQAWSYAVFKHDLGLMGLPLKEEENVPSASRVVMPRQELDADQLKKAFNDRPQTKGGDSFMPVTLKLSNPILPQHLTPEILNDWFKKNDWYGDVGEPVKTLEEEVERLKTSLPGEIAQAADAIAAEAKTEEKKREKLDSLLMPLAFTPQQIEALEKKIKQVPAGQLDERIKDAAQRRILVAILTPLEKYRPAEGKEFKDRLLAQAADYDSVKLERLQDLLQRRLQATLEKNYDPALHFGGKEWEGKSRDTIEKRNAIAFLVTTVAHTKIPDGKLGKLLQPNGPERAQVVLGLYEYAYAVQRLTATMIASFERVLEAVRNDREGLPFMYKGKMERNLAFVDRYRAEVGRIQDLVATIDKNQKRLDDLEGQKADHQKIVDNREMQVKEVTDKLLKARVETHRQLQELEKLQKQFFKATKNLIDAQEQNLRREKELRHWESLTKKKGGQS